MNRMLLLLGAVVVVVVSMLAGCSSDPEPEPLGLVVVVDPTPTEDNERWPELAAQAATGVVLDDVTDLVVVQAGSGPAEAMVIAQSNLAGLDADDATDTLTQLVAKAATRDTYREARTDLLSGIATAAARCPSPCQGIVVFSDLIDQSMLGIDTNDPDAVTAGARHAGDLTGMAVTVAAGPGTTNQDPATTARAEDILTTVLTAAGATSVEVKR